VQYATASDLVSGGQPASFFALTDLTVDGTAVVLDGATFAPGTVSPDGILAYFGPVACSPNEQVLVNGVLAPILFSNATQINFVTFVSFMGSPVTIQLVCNGTATITSPAPAAPVSPSLFTQTGTGTGQGSILNAGNSINSAANPAGQGSYISVFGRGFGSFNARGSDSLRHVAATVTAIIGGQNATVLYAGEAPGLTSGLQQINLQVPAGIEPGPKVAIVLTANSVATQAGVSVAVK
jgi:uncharacterized protein (TIGR03437 family)